MEFIEQIFGLSPDGGSGISELMFAMVPLLGLLALYCLRGHRWRT